MSVFNLQVTHDVFAMTAEGAVCDLDSGPGGSDTTITSGDGILVPRDSW